MVWAKSSLHPAGTSRDGSKAYPEFRLNYTMGHWECTFARQSSGVHAKGISNDEENPQISQITQKTLQESASQPPLWGSADGSTTFESVGEVRGHTPPEAWNFRADPTGIDSTQITRKRRTKKPPPVV